VEAEISRFRKETELSIAVMLALGIITLLLAPLTGHYRGLYLCLTLGLITVIVSAAYLPVIHMKRASSLKDIAIPAMQSLWVSTSMGLGYIVTALADYFQIVFPVAATLFIVGWIMLFFGLYRLTYISKKANVPLAI